MSLSAGARLGPYETASLIGAGGMGEVYRARDTRLERAVAVKVLPAHLAERPELRARFEREARTVAALNHPNICTLYDVGEATLPDPRSQTPEPLRFLVMEYLDGETLAARLTRGPLPLDQAFFYYHTYAVSPDGQRFLIPRPVSNLQGDAASSPITVVLNWTAALKR